MYNPLVSIIIPTYNGGSYLLKTIESAYAQDYDNKEIIVVDDGSTRDIKSLIKTFEDSIIYIRQSNSGPGAARKKGFEFSHGELIAFLDHDDLWSPIKISTQVKFFRNDPKCGLVYCYPTLIDKNGKLIYNVSPSSFPQGSVFAEFLTRNRITTFSSCMIRRTAYDKVGGIDIDPNLMTCDDYDLWLRLAYSFSVAFSPGELTFYRIHPGNLIKNYELNFNSHIAVINKCKELIAQIESPKETLYLNRCIKKNLYHTYRKFAFNSYYDFKIGDNEKKLKARNAFFKTLTFKFYDFKCLIYFLMSCYPLFMFRKLKRYISQ